MPPLDLAAAVTGGLRSRPRLPLSLVTGVPRELEGTDHAGLVAETWRDDVTLRRTRLGQLGHSQVPGEELRQPSAHLRQQGRLLRHAASDDDPLRRHRAGQVDQGEAEILVLERPDRVVAELVTGVAPPPP